MTNEIFLSLVLLATNKTRLPETELFATNKISSCVSAEYCRSIQLSVYCPSNMQLVIEHNYRVIGATQIGTNWFFGMEWTPITLPLNCDAGSNGFDLPVSLGSDWYFRARKL